MKKPYSQRTLPALDTKDDKNKTKGLKKNRNTKTHSHSLFKPNSAQLHRISKSNVNKAPNYRSKILSSVLPKKSEQPQKISAYQIFVKELKIKLPTPRQKFLEFLDISPYNRLKNHIDFISHILKTQFQFFKQHPSEIVDNIARKIEIINLKNLPNVNYALMLVFDEGKCLKKCYETSENGQSEEIVTQFKKGQLVSRNNFNLKYLEYDSNTSILGLNVHDYSLFISQYLNENMEVFKKFIRGLQIFKIFPENAMNKIFTGLSIHYFSKNETLYSPQEEAKCLFLMYQGIAARKVTVEIDQTNRIPLQKYEKLVKVFSRFYEHKILFKKEDLIGVSEIIENKPFWSEKIVIDEDSIIIAIDRISIEQSFDEYIIDRFQKYNMRKYPKNYDQLCENYFKEKIEMKKAEQRKIMALRGEIENTTTQKKYEKINGIINFYKQRIKMQQNEHLVKKKKKLEKLVVNQN